MSSESACIAVFHIQAQRWERREFIRSLGALAAAAGLSAYDMRSAAAEAAPETTTIRIVDTQITCIAPQIVAQALLYAEGFKEVKYLKWGKTPNIFLLRIRWPGKLILAFLFPRQTFYPLTRAPQL